MSGAANRDRWTDAAAPGSPGPVEERWVMSIPGSREYDVEDAATYSKRRWWLGLTWGDVIDRAADLYPRKIGLVDDTSRLRYGELREQVDGLAIALAQLGIRPRDRVLIQIPNWNEYVLVFFALQKIAAIPVLLLPRHTEMEIRHFADLTQPTAWILPLTHRRMEYEPIIAEVRGSCPSLKHVLTVRADRSTPFVRVEDLMKKTEVTGPLLKELSDRRPDPMEVAQIMPTGGTTGMPKAAPRTHNSFLCNVEYHARAWEITSEDTVMTIAPVSHGQGMLCGIGGALFNFAKLVLIDSTKPEDILSVVEREKVTAIPTVPAIISRMVHFDGLERYDVRSLKKIYAGGAPSTRDLIRKAIDRFDVRFVSAFGSVEGTNAMTRLEDDIDIVCESVGKPCCPYETYKIINQEEETLPPGREGELVSKGPGIFTGYFHSEEENRSIFTRDGFLKTGDLAGMDEDGYIRITGRIKDIILRGGENISSKHIENLISDHPDVEDVAVIGMPDEELGERICAYIQRKTGSGSLSFDRMIDFLKSKGASVLNLPERIEFVDEMPLTKAGKTDKKNLREDIQSKLMKEKAIS